MVSKKKAFRVSLLSSVVVGGVHWLAHYIFRNLPVQEQVIYVGIATTATVFLVAYYGMRS